MRKSLSAQSLTVATTSFLVALVAGGALLMGTGGASAASDATCHISAPVETANAFGNHVMTWTGAGNCGGVSVNLVAVTGTESTILQSDALADDYTATFTYGSVANGTVYQFEILGESATTADPITLKTVSSD